MANLVKLCPIPRLIRNDVRVDSLHKLLDAGKYIVGICGTLIFRYNLPRDEWTFVMELPDFMRYRHGEQVTSSGMFVIEKESERLFISCNGTRMMVIDLNIGSIIHQAPPTNEQRGQAMVKVGDIFHRVDLSGGNYNNRYNPFEHDIWNRTDQKWESNEDITNLVGFGDWIEAQMFQFEDIEATSLIHVPSQSILLLFCNGGADMQYLHFGVWRYHITKGQWTRVDGIEFSFGSGIVLTADQKYVVIVGGEELYIDDEYGCEHEVENQDDIFVLDIQNEAEYKLWGTSIRFPQAQLHGCKLLTGINGATSSRESANYILLTSGWVRKLFASELFIGILFPPLVIIEMIEEYRRNEETIHWLATETMKNVETWKNISREENHYAVPLKQILSSMSETAHQIEEKGFNYWTGVCDGCGRNECVCWIDQ